MSESLSLAKAGNAYAPDAEEREELGHLSSRPPLIKFDGSGGRFINTKKEGDKGVDSFTGIILGHRGGDLRGCNGGGQVLFGESLLGKDKATELGVGAKWVCRNHDMLSMAPMLNPELAPAVINQAKMSGAGTNCLRCPMREFGEDNSRPKCAAKLNLIMLGEDNNVYLVQVGGKSITSVNKLLAQFNDAKVATFCCKVTLRSEQVKQGSQKWQEVRGDIDVGNLFPVEQFYQLRELRKTILASYASHIDGAEAASEAPPHAAQQRGFGADDVGMDDVPF